MPYMLVSSVASPREILKSHDFSSPKPKGKRGPHSKKGALQPNLAHRLTDPTTILEKATILWYGGYMKDIEFVSGVSLWYHRGLDPAPLRWVLVRAPDNSAKPAAFFCSDPKTAPIFILQ